MEHTTASGPGGNRVGRLILYGAVVAGLALVVLGFGAEPTSMFLITIGAIVLLVTVPMVIVGIRLRSMSPEELQARLDRLRGQD